MYRYIKINPALGCGGRSVGKELLGKGRQDVR
jgi:hypothetical protein